FPRSFFMSRIHEERMAQAMRAQPLPAGWERATLEKEWDQRAGKRRDRAGAQTGPDGAATGNKPAPSETN
ncbi:MAG TPA: hypothetical protein VEC99_11615, partial [Clostridia bacterium]|nr:hypothetical protein [Clostridia bacterium]